MHSSHKLIALFLVGTFLAACAGGADDAATEPQPTTVATATSTMAQPEPTPSPSAVPSVPSTKPDSSDSATYTLLTSWGGPVIPQLPGDVAVLDDGWIIVSDTGRNEIQIYAADGTLLNSWSAGAANDQGPFALPSAVAATADDIYVAYQFPHKLVRFNFDGELLSEYDFEEHDPEIWDLVAGDQGRIYAVAGEVRQGPSSPSPLAPESPAYGVHVFDRELNLETIWKTPENLYPTGLAIGNDGVIHVLLFTVDPDAERPQYDQPARIASFAPDAYSAAVWTENLVTSDTSGQFDGLSIGADGRYYLIEERSGSTNDTDVTRIHIVDQDGLEVDQFEVEGQGNVAASRGAGIVVRDGAIYLADAWIPRILKLDLQGNLLSEISGVESGLFSAISAIAAGPDNTLYVADRALKRVQVFGSAGQLQQTLKFSIEHPNPLAEVLGMSVTSDGTVFLTDRLGVPLRAVLKLSATGSVEPIKIDQLAGGGPQGGVQFSFSPGSIASGPDVLLHIVMESQPWVRTYRPNGEFVANWPGVEDNEQVSQTALQVAAGPQAVFALVMNTQGQSIFQIKPLSDSTAETAIASFAQNPDTSQAADAIKGQPLDFAINADGNFYVLDGVNKQLIKLDSTGQELGRWDLESEPERHYQNIAVGAQGYVYLSDSLNDEIVVYAPQS